MESTRETLRERIPHGRKTFPYTVYHARIPEWLPGFPLHWHDEFEIILVMQGRVVLTVNGKRCLCARDDIVLIPPGTVHGISRYAKERAEYFNIIFSLSLLEENMQSHCWRLYLERFSRDACLREYRVRKGTQMSAVLLFPVRDLVEHRNENYSGYELMIKSRLFEIMHHAGAWLVDPGTRRDGAGHPRLYAERIKRVLSYVASSYADHVDVRTAAGLCAVSEGRFMKLFREGMGMSFIQYVKDYRLQAGAEQLLATGDTVTEVSAKSGFDNVSYFIRAFRKKFGCTPQEYRRQRMP